MGGCSAKKGGYYAMGKRALVSGVTGQDGSYLAEFLLEKGYEVYGLVRRTSQNHASSLPAAIHLVQGDLLDMASLIRGIEQAEPDEVYNLAGFTHVGDSFNQPVSCFEQTGLGAIRLLEAIRMVGGKGIRYYQASSSEMYGNASISPQDESTPFHPRSPYGVAKLAAHAATVNYREAYGLFACCGILFNHESPRRGLDFVTRKIARGVARIACGLEEKLIIGNALAWRDWGYAGDYVRAMWMMLQQKAPGDYVIATGEMHAVHHFLDKAFAYVGIPEYQQYIEIDPALLRPAEISKLCGDATKAREQLGWQPTYSFEQLVAMMVESELAYACGDRSENQSVGQEGTPRILQGTSRPGNVSGDEQAAPVTAA
jgi:GDPmannose 4,6-dehydratase